jgi:hypothetical protein
MSASIWKNNPLAEPQQQSTCTVSNDPDQEQNRLIVEKHSLLKCQLFVDAPFFTAPGSISGRLDLHNSASATSSSFKIRNISLELFGFEEVKDKHAPVETGRMRRLVFLKQLIQMQTPESPPTDAVIPNELPDSAGYRSAKPGLSQFPFVFDIQASAVAAGLPGSFFKSGNRIAYELVANVWLRDNKAVSILKYRLPIKVYPNRSPLIGANNLDCGAVQTASKVWGLFSGKGPVSVKAVMDRTMLVAGLDAFVGLQVDNQSSRRLSFVQLDLVRRIKTYRRSDVNDQTAVEPILFKKRSVNSRRFLAKRWDFDGQPDRQLLISIPVPFDSLTVSSGLLLDCSYTIQLTVGAKLRCVNQLFIQ